MDEISAGEQQDKRRRGAVSLAVVGLALLRLCHVNLLWADEDYHLAAALNLLHGRVPYRDFWYDKPPLSAIYYWLIGGYAGWPLRLFDAAYAVLACYLMYRLARVWWSEREGQVAAVLLAFFLTFYLPSAVIAFAADALMIAPHIAAVYFAFSGRAWQAGALCAVAFLANAKALFVLAVCGIWLLGSLPMLLIGFAVPLLLASDLAVAAAAWAGYCEQVWRWGWIYAAQSPVLHPFAIGVTRSLHWLGFHAALAGGAGVALWRSERRDRWRLASWLLISFAAVCLGTRFAPHYFLQLLPAMVVAAARGLVLAWRRRPALTIALASVALLVPFVRFGPRYASLAYDNMTGKKVQWSDVVMDQDARAVAEVIRSGARAGDTLFVWGYRPDIYVYTRLTSDSKFWDSQALTGVPADRHLQAKDAIYGGAAAADRMDFVRSRPVWVVDGLGLLNPRLAPAVYPELREWLKQYRVVGRTRLSVVYKQVE